MTKLDRDTLRERITEYLSGGGLFNPELANHDAVRDLLIDCRDALATAPAQDIPVHLKRRGMRPDGTFPLSDDDAPAQDSVIEPESLKHLIREVPAALMGGQVSEILDYIDEIKATAPAQDSVRVREALEHCVASLEHLMAFKGSRLEEQQRTGHMLNIERGRKALAAAPKEE